MARPERFEPPTPRIWVIGGRGNDTIGKGDHRGNIDAERAHQRGVLGGCAQIGTKPRALDDEPGTETDEDRECNYPRAVIRQNMKPRFCLPCSESGTR